MNIILDEDQGIGDRIRHLRKRNGFSQEKLAEHLGLTSSAIGSYEIGRAKPSLEAIIKISETFKISIDWLTKGTEVPISKQEGSGEYKMLREENKYLKDQLKDAMEIIRNLSLGKDEVIDHIAAVAQQVTGSVTYQPAKVKTIALR